MEQVAVDDEVDGETDSQLRQRYLHSDMGEVSDPELWHRLRYGSGDSSSESLVSSTPPHEPFAANFIEAIDVTRDEVGNVAICSYLLSRCNRRFQEAGEEGTRRHYSDAINSLNNSFGRFEAGELSATSGDLRDILREFARMSPRASSPTSSLSVAQIADGLRRYEQQRHDVDMEDEDEMDIDMEEVNGNDGAVAFGPLNHDESVLQDIHDQRRRVLAEIRENLHQAHSLGDYEAIEYWEAQEDWWINAF